MKQNRPNVEQCTNYSSRFELNIRRYEDFTHVQYALSLRHRTRKFVVRFRLSSAVMAVTCSFIIKRFPRMRLALFGLISISWLVLCNDFFELSKIYLRTHSTISSDAFVRPDPFLLHKHLPLWMQCAMSKSALLLATAMRTPSQMHAAQTYATVVEHTPTQKTLYLFQRRAFLYQ